MIYKALHREHEPHSNNNDIQSTTQRTRATLKQQWYTKHYTENTSHTKTTMIYKALHREHREHYTENTSHTQTTMIYKALHREHSHTKTTIIYKALPHSHTQTTMIYKALHREHEPHSNNNDIQSTTQRTRATLKQQWYTKHYTENSSHTQTTMIYKALHREHEPHSNNNDIQRATLHRELHRATLKQQWYTKHYTENTSHTKTTMIYKALHREHEPH